MPVPVNPADLIAAQQAYAEHGTKAAAARALGIPVGTLKSRLEQTIRPTLAPRGRKEASIQDGIVLIGSDAHFWPGEPSTAFRAFLLFSKKIKPKIVVMNGDALDAASISRHPPIGWNHQPSVKAELDVAKERLAQLITASPQDARFYWPMGNHDARFETRLAQVAPEFKDVHGISLKDHFPEWEPCWSLFINDERGVVIKHRLRGGMHAPHNNTLWAGRSMVTGHLHSLKVSPISDYNGTRFGVDGGCLADPYHEAFNNYTEDSPKNWRSGFVVLTFVGGRLLWPEVCHVIEHGLVEFRGELIHV